MVGFRCDMGGNWEALLKDELMKDIREVARLGIPHVLPGRVPSIVECLSVDGEAPEMKELQDRLASFVAGTATDEHLFAIAEGTHDKSLTARQELMGKLFKPPIGAEAVRRAPSQSQPGGGRQWKSMVKLRERILGEAPSDVAARFVRAGSNGSDDQTAAERSIMRILGAHYGNGHGATLRTLSNTVISAKPAYRDVVVELTLTDDDESEERYHLDYHVRFAATIDRYVAAFVTSAELGDLVTAVCPDVNDAWVLSDEAGRKKVLENLGNAVSVSRSSRTGTTMMRPVSLTEMDQADRKLVLRDLEPHHDLGDILLYTAEIPTSAEPVRIDTRYSFTMRKDDNYCFWAAGRPMHVRSIEFDATRFCRDQETRLIPQPFLGLAAVQATGVRERRVHFDVDNWLVSGQGAMLVWSSAR